MKSKIQILQMIADNSPIVIGVRGDDREFDYLDYLPPSMHQTEEMDEPVELDGTCALKFWEFYEDNDIERLAERLDAMIEYARKYGKNVYIIACSVNNYTYGWDDTDFDQEIVMQNAYVLVKL